jgi:Tripartite ATP-independent periplasmic transporters, DctQ component
MADESKRDDDAKDEPRGDAEPRPSDGGERGSAGEAESDSTGKLASASDGEIAGESERASRGEDKSERDESERLGDPAGGERLPGAAWGRPFARLDKAWTKFEAWLCAIVLVLEVLSLSLWVALKGMSAAPGNGNYAGIVFRALAGATILCLIGYLALRKASRRSRRYAALTGFVAGIVLAKAWSHAGVEYSSNWLNWFQQASFLTLFGGLSKIGTRLTLMLALLGGSLATAAGKHITIDLITRFLNPKARTPVIIFGWVGSGLICIAAAWGFFDQIAIQDFGAQANATAMQKVKTVADGADQDWFIARKQIDLDLITLPHVLKGQSYSNWLTGKQWNAWVDGAGFAARYGKQKTDEIKLPDDARRAPIVIIPEQGEPRGELVNDATLVVPFGLFVIGVRFFLLCVLTLSGHMLIDPEASMEGADIKHDAPSDGLLGEDD